MPSVRQYDQVEQPRPRADTESGSSRSGEATSTTGAPRLNRASGRASRVARMTGRGATAAAFGAGRAATSGVKRARRFTHAQGADESGMSRLLEVHAFNTAGDAAVAVALAGTLFFAVPSGEARGQVVTFLALTMLPFAIVAPLIGPFLDRFRRGRRWAIGSTTAVRAFCCWVLAGAVSTESTVLFPAALGVLVASKAYGVTKAAAVPRLLPRGQTLVRANSRLSLTGTAGAVLSAPLAGLAATLGAQWALRYAFVLFVIATVLAILLPSRVDSSAGEEQVSMTDVGGESRRTRRAVPAVPPVVVTALRCNAGLRLVTGFLTMYMAFVLRDAPFAGWEGRETLLLGLVIGAAGVGNTLGTVLATLLRTRDPMATALFVLVLDAVTLIVAAVFYGLLAAVALGLTAGLCQSLGKLSSDALIQRDVPDAVRTSVFARGETLLQVSWVTGGFLGILLPLSPPQLGLGITAALVTAWAALVLSRRPRNVRTPQPA
ncbi:MAG: putative membrane protein [uncultured Nocardioidaceae bacterium]|uniref:Putative membrane protein n=1 Tax=uncultured Nocardioidaceae bacterium TaxID=253824 RepID=A0A6J4M9Q9_9ACTN|nr:MAG: putative membrane protein [uncultured Nocardioidaceae bacterium]